MEFVIGVLALLFVLFVTFGVIAAVRVTRAVQRGVERTGTPGAPDRRGDHAEREEHPAGSRSASSRANGWSCAPPSTGRAARWRRAWRGIRP